jgi:hypothetical protein
MGFYLTGHNIFSIFRPVNRSDQMPCWRQWLSRARVFLLAAAACIFFVMDPAIACNYFRGLVSGSHWIFPDSRVFLVMIPSLWIDFAQDRQKNEFVFLSWPLLVRACLLALAVLAVFLFSQSRISEPFIYQGF